MEIISMAQEEHVAILEHGVKVWNDWRKNNPETQPDLRGTNLQGADLSKADLRNALLSRADLRDTILVDADLTAVDDLISEQLAGADLSRAKLSDYIREFKGLENITYYEKLKKIQTSRVNFRWIISCCLALGITPQRKYLISMKNK
jgi:hypothetical protein